MTTSAFIRVLLVAAAPAALAAQVPSPRPAPDPVPAVPAVPAVPLAPLLPAVPLDPPMPAVPLEPLMSVELAMPDIALANLRAAEVELNLDVHGLADLAMERTNAALRDLDLARVSRFSLGDDRLLEARPRAPWAAEDPADSLYRLARETLNRGEYRRAAQLFNEVTKKFPTSRYAMDSAYWEAFARYRLGTTDELKVALQILEGKGAVALSPETMMKQGRGSGTIDIPALRARVQGALAARGDRDAAAALQAEARQNTGCDREEVSVRAEALQALAQMDLQGAMPTVKKVLLRRDECTVELRRRALYLVARQPDAEAASLVLDVAKNDPDATMRAEAMRVLPRVAGDNAVPQLEELLRTAPDERAQRSAVYALASIDNESARKAVRALIERPDANEKVRSEAILSLTRDRESRSADAGDLAYLRTLYPKLESPKLREAVVAAVGRMESAESQQFLMGVVRNDKEASSVRGTALYRLGSMSSVSVNEIAKLYDVADARTLREQVLNALAQRKEPEAIDKMMEIARKDTDPQIRRVAISLLGRSNNERAKQLLKELIEK